MKKVLLDENLPRPLKKHFSSDFDVVTVADLKWQSLKNGQLLQAIIDESIDILITADRNLQYQQNLAKYPIQIVVLIMYDNRYKTLFHWIPKVEEEIKRMNPNDKIIEVDLREKGQS